MLPIQWVAWMKTLGFKVGHHADSKLYLKPLTMTLTLRTSAYASVSLKFLTKTMEGHSTSERWILNLESRILNLES